MDVPVHNAPPAEGLQVPGHIDKYEDVAAALKRLAGDDLAAARRELTGGRAREARIHSARQRLKRVRTVLRVLEAAPGEATRVTRRSLTAIARMLAGARDADVVAASARELAAATPRAAELGFDRVVTMLEEEATRAHQEKPPVGDVDRLLAALAADIAALKDGSLDGQSLLDTGFARAYRRGRRWMRRARANLGTPELHSWRKNVKDLWHLVWLAQARISRKGQKLEPVLERLASLLGLDHDHAVLAEKLALSPTGDLALMAQLELIADRRRELEAEAFELGGSVYGESPRAFVRDLQLR
jgi:CHAD domain-containing protein